MIIGVLKEPDFETRVSLLPEAIQQLVKKNIVVYIEQGAGEKSYASDDDYQHNGAKIASKKDIINSADIIFCIHPESTTDIQNKILIGNYQPLIKTEFPEQWSTALNTVFSLDMLPRTTRAQSMDILSSQANIAGYKAVLIASAMYARYFPMFMTAAGSIAPAKVLILGAGVAGLQAIATAKRLGAVVTVFDTRPAVKEEVMSLGAKFIEVEGAADASNAGGYAVEQTEEFKQKQIARIAESVLKADIIITTAQIPGKKAPILITEQMISTMGKGSIIMDLASATGGNTPYTKNNETVYLNGVSIIGNSNLAATMPSDASKLYGKNVLNFLQLIMNADMNIHLNFDDDLVKGCCINHAGAIVHERLLNI